MLFVCTPIELPQEWETKVFCGFVPFRIFLITFAFIVLLFTCFLKTFLVLSSYSASKPQEWQ